MRHLLASALASLLIAGFMSGAFAQEIKGNAQAGEKKAAMCIGCHSIPRYQSSFPEVHKVPMLAGQTPKYLQAALAAYKAGERKHPTMRGIATSLSEQDMADLAAYYASLPGETTALQDQPAQQPAAEVAALLQKANCASCHGANFSKPIDPSFPKIAGQHADYLYVALKSYQTQRNPNVGRSNPVMGGMTAGLTPAQLKQIAQYIGSLPGELHVTPQARFK